jgi:hypothetical protein
MIRLALVNNCVLVRLVGVDACSTAVVKEGVGLVEEEVDLR